LTDALAGTVQTEINGEPYAATYEVRHGMMHLSVDGHKASVLVPIPGVSNGSNAEFFLRQFVRSFDKQD
jgi:hypothetical protein